MKCPYCISEVDESALACPHCTRDLYLFKPILVKLGALESELATVKERLGKLEVQRAESDAAAMSPEAVDSSSQVAEPAADLKYGARSALIPWFWLAPLAMLVIAHFLITIVFDINLVWLRLVSLLIPLPFGYLLMSKSFHRFPYALLMAFLVAVVAIFAMSGVVHLVDGAAILPQGRHDWLEFMEYAASISFSFAAGMLLGRREWRRQQAVRRGRFLINRFVSMLLGSEAGVEKINFVAGKVTEISRSLTTSGAVIVSLYTGLHKFL